MSVQVNVHEAKTQLSKLLEMVEQGEEVVIARHGSPVAVLVRVKMTGFPFGIGRDHPLVAAGDEWWQPMTDEEADQWISGE